MDHPFRSAPLGGFNKQDVLAFLAEQSKQAAQAQQQLQEQLEGANRQAEPLRQEGEELRRGGVVYRGKFYPVGGRVTWRGVNTVFLSSTYLHLGQKKGINVSFMKDAEKLFARAYSNTVS